MVPLELVTLLTLLEHLDLSHNRIYELPSYFGELRRLRHLNLAHNDIAEFPGDRMDVLGSVTVRRMTTLLRPWNACAFAFSRRNSTDEGRKIVLFLFLFLRDDILRNVTQNT